MKLIQTSLEISPTGLILNVAEKYNIIIESLDEKYLSTLPERVKELESILEPEIKEPEAIDVEANFKLVSKFLGIKENNGQGKK